LISGNELTRHVSQDIASFVERIETSYVHMGTAGNDDVGQVGIQRRLFIAFRGGEYAGDGFHAFEKLAGDGVLADSDVYDGGRIAPLEIVGVGPNEFEVEKIFGIETEIDAGENEEAPHQEAGTDKQDDREGHFGDDENRAEFALPKPGASARASAGEVRLHIAANDGERGR
jgi:hypothetical protein